MTDYRRIVQEALENGMGPDDTIEVDISRGELILFHVLLQEHAAEYVDSEHVIPLLERHVSRMK